MHLWKCHSILSRVVAHLRLHPWTKLTSLITIVLAGFSIADPKSPVSGVMMIFLGVNHFCRHAKRTGDDSMPGWFSPGVAAFCIVVGVATFFLKLSK